MRQFLDLLSRGDGAKVAAAAAAQSATDRGLLITPR